MKKNLILSLFVLFSAFANAQKVNVKEVPEPVIKSFILNFWGVNVEKWEKEAGNYEAEFDWKGIETSALFSAEGTLLETEREVSKTELPAVIIDYVSANYAGYTYKETAVIVYPNGTKNFETELKKGKKRLELLFDEKGGFIKRVDL